MKYADLQIGMKIRALVPWANCWAKGDEFVVFQANDGEFCISCHDVENGPEHGLDGMEDENGDIPEFEPVPVP